LCRVDLVWEANLSLLNGLPFAEHRVRSFEHEQLGRELHIDYQRIKDRTQLKSNDSGELAKMIGPPRRSGRSGFTSRNRRWTTLRSGLGQKVAVWAILRSVLHQSSLIAAEFCSIIMLISFTFVAGVGSKMKCDIPIASMVSLWKFRHVSMLYADRPRGSPASDGDGKSTKHQPRCSWNICTKACDAQS
jgi:hypothetical protein